MMNCFFTLPWSSAGRSFKGTVIKKFPNRVVVEIRRIVKIPKYERFHEKKTKIHSRIPKDIEVKVGDYIKVQECRPLSKIIHSIVIKKIRSQTEVKGEKK